MKDLPIKNQMQAVSNFQDLVSSPLNGNINAMYWSRQLEGDFAEIVEKIELKGNITVVTPDELQELQLSTQGELARKIILNDWKLLEDYGAAPTLNLLKSYERDDAYPFLPTDVYSFHVDRSPIPIDTFLCTYHGSPSEILPNKQAIQKVLVPEIRAELKKLYSGAPEDFESFLKEYFFDLHYQAIGEARAIPLGLGHLGRLAVDHPESLVLPCVHRAPEEKGLIRLLLIC